VPRKTDIYRKRLAILRHEKSDGAFIATGSKPKDMSKDCPKCGKTERKQAIRRRMSRKCDDCGVVFDGVRYWEIEAI